MLTDPGVIAVVRVQDPAQVPALAEALVAGGIIAIEITMTIPNAVDAIREARRAIGKRAIVGVGTVLDTAMCEAAIQAGAEFVVTPVCRPEIVPVARSAGRPIMLGAFTPSEAQAAHEAGADFVKIFPAENLGPAYIRALRGPLPHLRLVPTGGVDPGNIGAFFEAGCAAVGVGSSLLAARMIEEADWPAVTRRAAEFVKAAALARRR